MFKSFFIALIIASQSNSTSTLSKPLFIRHQHNLVSQPSDHISQLRNYRLAQFSSSPYYTIIHVDQITQKKLTPNWLISPTQYKLICFPLTFKEILWHFWFLFLFLSIVRLYDVDGGVRWGKTHVKFTWKQPKRMLSECWMKQWTQLLKGAVGATEHVVERHLTSPNIFLPLTRWSTSF